MVGVNIIVVYTIAMVAASVVTVQVNSVPVNDDAWLYKAQNSIKRIFDEVGTQKVDGAFVKLIADGQFDEFANFVKEELSKLVDETIKIDSEEMVSLRLQLIKWFEGLERVNSEPDYDTKSPKKALNKYFITIDFMIHKVNRFIKHSHFKSPEAKKIVERLNVLLKISVTTLVGHAESVRYENVRWAKTQTSNKN